MEETIKAREDSPWLSLTEFAARWKVSRLTVLKWTQDSMPHARPANKIRINVEEGDAWVVDNFSGDKK